MQLCCKLLIFILLVKVLTQILESTLNKYFATKIIKHEYVNLNLTILIKTYYKNNIKRATHKRQKLFFKKIHILMLL